MWFQPQSVHTSTTRTVNSPNSFCISTSSTVDLIRPEYWPNCSPNT